MTGAARTRERPDPAPVRWILNAPPLPARPVRGLGGERPRAGLGSAPPDVTRPIRERTDQLEEGLLGRSRADGAPGAPDSGAALPFGAAPSPSSHAG
jgi:hypothetical protein